MSEKYGKRCIFIPLLRTSLSSLVKEKFHILDFVQVNGLTLPLLPIVTVPTYIAI